MTLCTTFRWRFAPPLPRPDMLRMKITNDGQFLSNLVLDNGAESSIGLWISDTNLKVLTNGSATSPARFSLDSRSSLTLPFFRLNRCSGICLPIVLSTDFSPEMSRTPFPLKIEWEALASTPQYSALLPLHKSSICLTLRNSPRWRSFSSVSFSGFLALFSNRHADHSNSSKRFLDKLTAKSITHILSTNWTDLSDSLILSSADGMTS